jgi:hypothetical protein
MTQRKPPGIHWETWVDRQIREAQDRGEFDELPGNGQPIPDLDKPYDENWWIRGKLRSEGLSYLPPSLALKKEAEDAHTAALIADSEADARKIIEHINTKIRTANRTHIAGPSVMLVPYDIERVASDWRDKHPRVRSG